MKFHASILAAAVLSLVLTNSALAQDTPPVQPSGPLPALGGCAKIKGKGVCVQPTVMVATVVDLKSGNIERGVALGAGYAIILPKAFYGHDVGVNAVGGVLTGGNWQVSLSPRIGNAFAGITVSHKNAANYAGANFGVTY